MKVKELIAELQKMPPDKDVFAEEPSGLYEIQVSEYRNETYPEDETYIVISPA